MFIPLIIGLVSAQEVQGGNVPQFNAQIFRPAVDSHQFLWLNDTSIGQLGVLNYRNTISHSKSPIVYLDHSGKVYNLLDSVTQMDLSAGFTTGALRYAISAPIILQATGERVTSVDASDLKEAGLGEMMADIKLQLLDRDVHRIGMSVNTRTSLPTATTELPLGTNGLLFEVEGAIDAYVGHSVLAFNLGHRQQPSVETESIVWGNQLLLRAGYAQPFNSNGTSGLAVEYNFAGLYEQMNEDGVAMEAMISGWGTVNDTWNVHAGVAKGLSNGMTTPKWRGVLSVSFLHKTDSDRDADGVVDHSDICPATPEDVDTVEDTDGCPEPTKVNVLMVDQLGHELRDVHWTTSDGQFSGFGYTSFYTHAGNVKINITDPRYMPEATLVEVKDQAEQDVIIEMDAMLGSLNVVLLDYQERVISQAIWSIDGVKGASIQPTGYVVPLIPGEHEVIVQAHGYRILKETVNIRANETEIMYLVAKESKVTSDLEVLEKVSFKTNSHLVHEQSHLVLDEVAELLNHHQRIESVYIEGYTDSQGDEVYNKELSQKRADEVMRYLISKGVSDTRLQATGFGEEDPIDTNETAEGRHNNRRIVFRIEKHHGDDYIQDSAEDKTTSE
jgi:outer membrane protein OmpA-like peptidoglycan-associated protein